MLYIDNVKFARAKRKLDGELDLSKCSRIQEIDNFTGVLKYELVGSADSLNRPVLILSIYGIIGTLCQNCLQAMEITIDNQSQITVFFNEDQLDKAMFSDDESDADDGVLAEAEFDVVQLVEDEVIMLLPYASKHDTCIGLSYHDKDESPFSQLKNII